jgi:uncharacterized damage-inducible protein DinB
MGRSAALASRLDQAARDFIEVIERVDDGAWRRTPAPAVWSISKDAEHVAEASAYHQWIVRLTIGENVPRRKPVLERRRVTSELTPAEMVALIRERTDAGVAILRGLTDEQLALPTNPPRGRHRRLAETIEHVLIGHYDGHRADIESKLAGPRTDDSGIADRSDMT